MSTFTDGAAGAAEGAQIGANFGPIGAGIGAVIGGVTGIFGSKKKRRRKKRLKRELENYRRLSLEVTNLSRAVTRRALTNQGIGAYAETSAYAAMTGAGRGSSLRQGMMGSVLTQGSGNLVLDNIQNKMSDALTASASRIESLGARVQKGTGFERLYQGLGGGQGISALTSIGKGAYKDWQAGRQMPTSGNTYQMNKAFNEW